MQAASLSRPEEVIMLTRRLVACACALALAVPAAAGARAGFDPPIKTDHVVYGDTKYDLQNTQQLGPQGDTKSDLAPQTVPVKHVAPVASPDDEGTNGWQIAAVAEAGLLAALALGAAAFVGRIRPRRGAAA
jgi:hypothetical protein